MFLTYTKFKFCFHTLYLNGFFFGREILDQLIVLHSIQLIKKIKIHKSLVIVYYVTYI